MAIQDTARKLRRNVEDYGWATTVSKSLSSVFGLLWAHRVYRLYRVSVQEREWEADPSSPFEFRFLTEEDVNEIAQVVSMAEWFAGVLGGKLSAGDLCLVAMKGDRVAGYRLRQPDGKRHAVEALRGLRFQTIAAGDSYNDTAMLGAADAGILFRPPENVIAEFPQYPVTREYDELRAAFEQSAARIAAR